MGNDSPETQQSSLFRVEYWSFLGATILLALFMAHWSWHLCKSKRFAASTTILATAGTIRAKLAFLSYSPRSCRTDHLLWLSPKAWAAAVRNSPIAPAVLGFGGAL